MMDLKLLNQMSSIDNRVYFNEGLQGQHNYIIRVNRVNNLNPSQELFIEFIFLKQDKFTCL